jgi:hypothetical protein
MIAGRGACHHPDGAVLLVTTAFEVFRRELEAHARLGRCRLPEVQSHVA